MVYNAQSHIVWPGVLHVVGYPDRHGSGIYAAIGGVVERLVAGMVLEGVLFWGLP